MKQEEEKKEEIGEEDEEVETLMRFFQQKFKSQEGEEAAAEEEDEEQQKVPRRAMHWAGKGSCILWQGMSKTGCLLHSLARRPRDCKECTGSGCV